MESLISDIGAWYSRNMLKLNDSKTEMLIIRSKCRQNLHFRDINIGESIISPSPSIRNIGVIMDPTYTMSSHVSHLVQLAFLKLRELSYFRRYLTDESTKTAVYAYITSRLDYCISLLVGLIQELTNENAKCNECCSSTCHKNQEVWSYHSCSVWLALAACVLHMSI